MQEQRGYSILIVDFYGLRSHITRFIRNLKLSNPAAKISLFTDMPQRDFPVEIADYIDGFIKWKRYEKNPLGCKGLSFLRTWINYVSLIFQVSKLSRTKHYEIVNIHYPQHFMCFVMKKIRKMSSSIVVSPWGSDVLRLKGKIRKRRLAYVFRKADYITAGQTGAVGRIIINEMKINVDKFHSLAWGSETIDYINEHFFDASAEEARRCLGLEGRYVITCGYNAFEEQNHEVMINAINAIKDSLPNNLTLVFPLTYGLSEAHKKKYVGRLKQLCNEMNLNAVYFEEYLSVADLFLLRMSTDMFVHIQPTDAGNSSLQEYVLCGKKVVHGSWVHYQYLEKYKPLFYYPVEDLEHVGEAILKAYYSDGISVPSEVVDYIRNRGWKAKMKLWDDFFCSIC